MKPQVTIDLDEYNRLLEENANLTKHLKSKKSVAIYFELRYYGYKNYFIQTESEMVQELVFKCEKLETEIKTLKLVNGATKSANKKRWF